MSEAFLFLQSPQLTLNTYLVLARCSWAIGEGLITSNPVTGTKRTDEKSRDRVLDPAELRLIWNALENEEGSQIAILRGFNGWNLYQLLTFS